MRVVLKEIYNHNMAGDYKKNTRFYVCSENGRELEIINLSNCFFPNDNTEFERMLLRGYSGHRNPKGFEAEKDFLLGKPVNLKNGDMNYVYRYLDLLDVYYHDDEYMFDDVVESFIAEISPQALRVLIEPWKYGIDRRSVRARKGS